MSMQRDPRGGNIQEIKDRLYELERQALLAHSAIGREGLEVYDGGWIKILNGGLEVIGSAYITGRLISNGENIFNGTTEMNGPTTVAGDFSIEDGGLFRSGTVEIRPDGSADFGTLNIESDGTLNVNNDVNVMENGIINVGSNMKLTPTDDGGAMVFQDGSKVSSVAGTVQVKSSSPGVGFTAGLNTAGIGAGPTGAIMSVDDAGDWVVQGGQVSMQSVGDRISAAGHVDVSKELTVGVVPDAPSGATANLYWDSITKRIMLAL